MKVTLLMTVVHDGQPHAAGAVLDMPKADAEALVAAGAAQAAPSKTAKAAAGTPSESASE
jgi:hypothetical protein